MNNEEKLFNLINELSHDQFWSWVGSWFDPEFVMTSIGSWEKEDIDESIETITNIIKNNK